MTPDVGRGAALTPGSRCGSSTEVSFGERVYPAPSQLRGDPAENAGGRTAARPGLGVVPAAQEREQFDKPIFHSQGGQLTFTDVATEREPGRRAAYSMAVRFGLRNDDLTYSSIATMSLPLDAVQPACRCDDIGDSLGQRFRQGVTITQIYEGLTRWTESCGPRQLMEAGGR